MNGLILVDKPGSFTSHDIVAEIRRITDIKKAGHFGTLDPMATGLLIIGLGTATRLFPFFLKLDKTYKGRMRLGIATDTYDIEGTPTAPESHVFPDRKKLSQGMNAFIGDIMQAPPPFSAKKYGGQRLYKLARKKKPLNIKPCPVTVRSYKIIEYSPPFLDFIVECASGTYIRSLAHDLGQKMNCGAHLTSLRRLRVGPFHVDNAHSLEEIKMSRPKNLLKNMVIPMESLLTEHPKVVLNEKGASLARNGNDLSPEHISRMENVENAIETKGPCPGLILRVFSSGGEWIALAKKDCFKNTLHPFLVLNNKTTESDIETKRKT